MLISVERFNMIFLLDDKQIHDTWVKIAGSSEIMKSSIPVPNDVAKIAEKAYDNRYNSDVNFGNSDMFEMARSLKNRSSIPLSMVLEIHKYTVKYRYRHSDSKKVASYWEWQLYGGEAGRKWSESIIRAYIPKEVRN
jgi:hypothetical protein